MRNNSKVQSALLQLSETLDSLAPKGGKAGALKTNGDLGDLVEQEMLGAARAIEEATEHLQRLMSRPRDTSRYNAVDIQVHNSILNAAMAITSAIAHLIKAATNSQQEIVAKGRGSSTSQQFYKKHNRWTEGLISAVQSVAFATNLLIESADSVIPGTHPPEQLIVTLNEVAAATAQLVAASHVKANLMSKTQEKLELAAKAVTEACKVLVKQVKAVTAKRLNMGRGGDSTMSLRSSPSHEPIQLPLPPSITKGPQSRLRKRERSVDLKAVQERLMNGGRSGRSKLTPPRVDSTQPRDTSPEMLDPGEETAGEEEEDDDGNDLLDLPYHPSYVRDENKRRHWENKWEILAEVVCFLFLTCVSWSDSVHPPQFHALDRQTYTTMILVAAPPHTQKLYLLMSWLI